MATEGDAGAVCDILRRSITQCCVDDHRYDSGVLERWLRNKTTDTVESWLIWPAHYPIVATVQDEVVGVGMLARPGRIVLLHVDPIRRQTGIGSALLRTLESKARKSGVSMLRVTSTLSARRFYESHGYSLVTATSAPYGAALAMAKRLGADLRARASACGCNGAAREA
ncbi:GNAT family N-acetyltransferase [Noviherbaspirillum sp. Root189]|uniref:GNAT family N-acetyltransferase n=1 Tax=Noviherbaspirillum sp. Root189 TaxID=1736487 RepID=UPI00070E403E|nr:GNAT family N-acetyltransferase [Noviherbaspirillum sp. Root189]KRB82177.1 hypothetical protein ASE07_24080 [Noviherbaspirillum sp. Root189]